MSIIYLPVGKIQVRFLQCKVQQEMEDRREKEVRGDFR